MTALRAPISPRTGAPRAAFGFIVRNEARLALRQPAGLIAGLGISVLLLVIFGEIPVFQQSSTSLGGLSAFDIYVPILMCFSIGVLALTYLPGPLVSYREMGILRRMSTTPVPASWLLAAQLVVQACFIIITVVIMTIVSTVFFGAVFPKNPGAMVLSIALCAAALFAGGLAIAAVARTAAAARGIMGAVFYPLMFFSGLYYPMQLMPAALQDISRYTPLGAADQAIGTSWLGHFPSAQPLLVLSAYTVVLGVIAKRQFKWE
jgi:ABC-2 type transport system permease protein